MIALEDSPAFWTENRLDKWCNILIQKKNEQPWSLQLFPREIDTKLMNQLFSAGCRQVHFIIPSCKKANLVHYHADIDMKTFSSSLHRLIKVGIEPRFTIWIGGPEETSSEVVGVLKFLKLFSTIKAKLQPFPYFPDSDLFASVPKTKQGATISDSMKWLNNPWNEQNPVHMWSGQKGHDYTEAAMTYLARSVSRNPKQILSALWKKTRSIDLIRTIEDRALSLLIKT